MRLSVVYLFLYNLVQAIGWTAIAIVGVKHYDTHDSYVGLYADVKILLNTFQTLAVLEVVHSATGIVRSNPFLTAVQLASRVFLIWGVLYVVPEAQDQIGVLFICIAWCITEIIRYCFYMGALVNVVPYPIQYARYTLFIILYPLGVCGEMLSIYHALPHVRDRGIWSVTLPNPANISFNYFYILIVIALSYFPLFPKLYFHMLALRRKVIGGEEHVKKD
jgi:very-long-chain (3R)-3-hydroxyacyl-CoA dehydratase